MGSDLVDFGELQRPQAWVALAPRIVRATRIIEVLRRELRDLVESRERHLRAWRPA